jgi:hypothetical protein
MTIEVKNVRNNKKLQMKADMEFNMVSLVQLWEKCEDAKAYMARLSERVIESGYSAKWESIISKSLGNVELLSEETRCLLSKMGAFDAIKKNTKESAHYSSGRTSQRIEAARTY